MKPIRKRRIRVAQVREPGPGLWSNCFVAGDQFVVAGQIAYDRNDRLVGPGDPYAQSIQALKNLKAFVEAAGARMADVLKINVYLTDIRYRPAFVEARKKFFKGDFPAAVVVGDVTLAYPGLLVEIDAWGVIGCGGKPRKSARGRGS